MPIYEYRCAACRKEFEELASAGDIPSCPYCGSGKTDKLMSKPCYHMAGSGGYASSAPSGGGACAGCSGGNCATCG